MPPLLSFLIIARTSFLTQKLGRIPIVICQVFFERNGPVGETLLSEADHSWLILES